jgi:hypothetical protein
LYPATTTKGGEIAMKQTTQSSTATLAGSTWIGWCLGLTPACPAPVAA